MKQYKYDISKTLGTASHESKKLISFFFLNIDKIEVTTIYIR